MRLSLRDAISEVRYTCMEEEMLCGGEKISRVLASILSLHHSCAEMVGLLELHYHLKK